MKVFAGILVIFALLPGCATAPSTVAIKVLGPPGAKVKATCEADGEKRDLGEKTVPAEFVVSAHTLSYEVRRVDRGKEFVSAEVYVDGVLKMKAKAPGGVRGGLVGPSYFNFGAGSSWIGGVPEGRER